VKRWQVVRQVGMSWRGMDFGVSGCASVSSWANHGELSVLIVRV
jgi:hypothetical protein